MWRWYLDPSRARKSASHTLLECSVGQAHREVAASSFVLLAVTGHQAGEELAEAKSKFLEWLHKGSI